MSNQNPGESDSSLTSPEPKSISSAPTKPPRSKVERAIVWGAIAIGVLIVAIEGSSYFVFKRAHRAIQTELQRAEESDDRITRDKVNELLGNRSPDQSKDVKVGHSLTEQHTERYDVYIFKGLLKERTLCVHYGVQGVMDEPEVIEVTAIIPDEIL